MPAILPNFDFNDTIVSEPFQHKLAGAISGDLSIGPIVYLQNPFLPQDRCVKLHRLLAPMLVVLVRAKNRLDLIEDLYFCDVKLANYCNIVFKKIVNMVAGIFEEWVMVFGSF